MFDVHGSQDSESGYLEYVADVYRDLEFQPPSGRLIAAGDVPPEFNRLLVHQRGMTRTLEAAYGQVVDLKVLKSVIRGGVLTRQVMLVLHESDTPAAMALGRIYLERLPEETRRLILEESTPLGTIMQLTGLMSYYHSHRYFALTKDPTVSAYLPIGESRKLYGRRVKISDPVGQTFADVVEIAL